MHRITLCELRDQLILNCFLGKFFLGDPLLGLYYFKHFLKHKFSLCSVFFEFYTVFVDALHKLKIPE